MEMRLFLLVDFGKHGVDNRQELHDALIQMQVFKTWWQEKKIQLKKKLKQPKEDYKDRKITA